MMSKRKQKFLLMAHDMAKRSHCNFKHGAVIVKNGKVLAKGKNKYQNMGIQIFIDHRQGGLSIHAELDALRQVKNVRGSDIFLSRAMKSGHPGPSKPCNDCQKLLDDAGIRNIYYT